MKSFDAVVESQFNLVVTAYPASQVLATGFNAAVQDGPFRTCQSLSQVTVGIR